MPLIPEGWFLGQKSSPRRVIKDASREIHEQKKDEKKLEKALEKVKEEKASLANPKG